MSNLKFLGFCGVDDTITDADIEQMLVLSRRLPCVEWGILFHPDKTGMPRYPTKAFVERLCTHFCPLETCNLAAHLCGNYVEQVLAGDATFVNKLFLDGFNRIQINATVENGVDVTSIPIDGLHGVIDATPYLDWIIQSNPQTALLVKEYVGKHPNVFVLHDASCGTGRTITQFPIHVCQHSGPLMQGYAGGLDVYNVSSTMDQLDKLDIDYWIDMESSLRSNVPSSTGVVSKFNVGTCAQIINSCLDKI